MTRYVFSQNFGPVNRGDSIGECLDAALDPGFIDFSDEDREKLLKEVRRSLLHNIPRAPTGPGVDTCIGFLVALIDLQMAGCGGPATRRALVRAHPETRLSNGVANGRLSDLVVACAMTSWSDHGLRSVRVFTCKEEKDLETTTAPTLFFLGYIPDPDLPPPASPVFRLEIAFQKLSRFSTIALSAALAVLASAVFVAGFLWVDGPCASDTVAVSSAPLIEKTLSIHATARGEASVVVGSSQSNLEHWQATIAGPGVAHYAIWPRDPQSEPEFYAVATQPLGADGPGELRVYDLRAPTAAGSEPETILRDMLDGDRFKPTPERVPDIGQPEAYGFFDVAFADLGGDLPTLIALAHDHNMAPTWVISYSLETGQPTAEIFHPGHLEFVAVNDTADRPFALIAGVNNRILCPDPTFEDCPLHVSPVAIVLDLPFDDQDGHQFIPGLGTTPEGQKLPVLHPWRYWQIDQDIYRFVLVQQTSNGTGNLKIEAHENVDPPEGQAPCWKFWHIDSSAEIADQYVPGLGDGADCREPAPELVEVRWGVGR